MLRWFTGRGARPARIEQALDALGEATWGRLVAQHPFMAGLTAAELDTLRQHTAWILASKDFHGAHGLDVTPAMRHAIAIQAALPILGLDTSLYQGWTQIVIYPGGFMVPRTKVDAAGVVHEYMMETSGEAWEGGPVILSWEEVRPGAHDRANVVIHEFAHKLDQRTGEADGMPSLRAHRDLDAQHWHWVLTACFNDFNRRLDAVERAIPANVDPESNAAAPWYDSLPLDAYAAADPAEFFAVSSEAFFVHPEPLAIVWPPWYELLAKYYRQDPLMRMRRVGIRPSTFNGDTRCS
ncbi:zinc-dependent peptidase [Castellaniella sp.]|uniref:M90 family metallopeptidase n=1 Tax=Castellaniella sp. TaxID=1955812 RepID=UPI00355FD33E